MKLELSDEQRMVQALAREFAEQEVKPVAAECAREACFPHATVKRMGELDSLSREFAREHSERLWKQLDFSSDSEQTRAESRTDGIVAFALAVAAAVLVKMPELFGIDLNHDAGFYARNMGFFVLPLLTGYFVWKRRLTTSTVRWLTAAFVAAGSSALICRVPRRKRATMPDKTVFVVDDDAGVRQGLRFMLRAAGYSVEAFPSARSFLEDYHPRRGGCLLLDIQMPQISGLELQQTLNLRGWRIPVIFITGHGTVPLAIAAMKTGAFDFIEKPLREDALVESIDRALRWNDKAYEERLERATLQTRAASLTPREREVFELVATGEPNKAIARHLGISFRTVELHRAHIIEKLQARSLSDLIRMAMVIMNANPTS